LQRTPQARREWRLRQRRKERWPIFDCPGIDRLHGFAVNLYAGNRLPPFYNTQPQIQKVQMIASVICPWSLVIGHLLA
ncbi:MAG TPA: hypothetical protein VIS78_12485, partial [Blastocatellia bacterium]